MSYCGPMSVHPVMRQNFAGKPYTTFYNIWDPVLWHWRIMLFWRNTLTKSTGNLWIIVQHVMSCMLLILAHNLHPIYKPVWVHYFWSLFPPQHLFSRQWLLDNVVPFFSSGRAWPEFWRRLGLDRFVWGIPKGLSFFLHCLALKFRV